MLSTPLCPLLGIDLPIIQVPIGSATTPALAAAVSNAGGLGMLAVTWQDINDLRRTLRATRQLTDRPFGVNLVLHWPPEERLAVCLEEGVPVVSFFWDDPAPYVTQVHTAGALVIHTVASAAEARQAVTAGVDVVVAQGWEAGGHVWGRVATLPLIPRVVDAVAPTPVVAAGGIADGHGLAAALALGAAGVWMGTRFLLSEEAATHAVYKERLRRATEADTTYAILFDGGWPDAPHRALRNSTVQRWEAAASPPSGRRPGEGETVAADEGGRPVVRYSDTLPLAGMTGDLEALALYAGQSVGLTDRRLSAARIVQDVAAEAAAMLRRCAALT